MNRRSILSRFAAAPVALAAPSLAAAPLAAEGFTWSTEPQDIDAQLRQLNATFAELAERAKDLGVNVDLVTRAHQLALSELRQR